MITLNEIHIRLADAIKNCGFTQSELARRLNINPTQVCSYIKGRKMPALDTLANLCKIIDVSPAYILFFEDESGTKLY